MLILKFGGTSVNTPKRLQTICRIVKNAKRKKPILVVSALSGVTDLLASLTNAQSEKNLRVIKEMHQSLIDGFWDDKDKAKELHRYIDSTLFQIASLAQKKLTKALQDKLLSYGEIMSSHIIASALGKEGLFAKQVIATDCIVTDEEFGNAEFLVGPTKERVRSTLLPLIKKGIVPVVTGFIGVTAKGKTTTLGRGGSDYSASIIGFCLDASEVQIWTDVDGIMTADPRIVKNAKTVEVVSYEEASELAVLGAKVLHPKTILPAVEKNIPVRILNTYNLSHKGTTILKNAYKSNYITSIAYKKGIRVIDIHAPKMYFMHGFLHKIFKIFDELAISVDFVSTSEISVSLTIDGHYHTTKLVRQLKEFADVDVKNNRATVSVVGRPHGTTPVIPGRLYSLFESKKIDVEMISAGASRINETIVIREKDTDDVVRMLHDRLIIERGNTL